MKYALLLLAACGGTTAPATVGNVADVTTDTTLRAVLVIHPYHPLRAYVLGCMRGGASVAADECSKLLVDRELELVVDPAPAKVRAGEGGRYPVCPAGEPYEPYVSLSGLPSELAGGHFIISPGLAYSPHPGPVPPAVAGKHGPVVTLPTNGPDLGPTELTAVFRVDLDGDGRYEIVVEELGQYTLYDELGTKLGSVGCVFG